MVKCFLISLCFGIFVAGMASAEPQESTDLPDVLLENGTITQEQYDKLKNKTLENKEEFKDLHLNSEGGLEVSTYDGKFAFELGARFMIDTAFYNENKNPLGNGTEIRSARVELQGTVFSDWDYEFSVEFSDSEVEVKDAFITYKGFDGFDLNMGQFKTPFSLEQMGTKNHITFLERGLLNELVPDRKVGIGAKFYGDLWTAEAGLFGEAYNEGVDDEGDEGWTTAGRITFAPYQASDSRVFHVGASGAYQVLNDDKEIRFRKYPESHLTSVDYVNTGKIRDVDNRTAYGLESALVYGPFSLQGEYVYTSLNLDDGNDASFSGAYVFGSWMLTGESRNYKSKKAAFGRMKPSRTYGALELAARYSYLDLNSSPMVFGGKEENITLAFNWYLNNYVRLMTNYVFVNNDEYADDDGDLIGDDDIKTFQIRLQISF